RERVADPVHARRVVADPAVVLARRLGVAHGGTIAVVDHRQPVPAAYRVRNGRNDVLRRNRDLDRAPSAATTTSARALVDLELTDRDELGGSARCPVDPDAVTLNRREGQRE